MYLKFVALRSSELKDKHLFSSLLSTRLVPMSQDRKNLIISPNLSKILARFC